MLSILRPRFRFVNHFLFSDITAAQGNVAAGGNSLALTPPGPPSDNDHSSQSPARSARLLATPIQWASSQSGMSSTSGSGIRAYLAKASSSASSIL